MFPHKQQELVDNLQNLGGKAIATSPSPDDIFSLDIFEDATEDTVTHTFAPHQLVLFQKKRYPEK